MEEFKAQGNALYANAQYQKAVLAYTKAIESAPPSADKAALAVLYSNRSASFFCLEKYEEALKDAEQALELNPEWGKGFGRKGSALMLLRRFEEAHQAFSKGLLYEPQNQQLLIGVKDAEHELEKAAAQKRKLAEITDDFECVLCLKLMYEPVTTPCGHSFCRSCLIRALDHNAHCPLCRTVLHMLPDHPISVTLQNIIQRNFWSEHEVRRKEMQEERSQDLMALPLFLLNTMAFPGQSFPLHIFEPRYRLMLRRCLSGSRRFGLVCATPAHPNGEDVGCILEITNVQITADGRSYIETKATNRFKILERSVQDGYMVGKVQLIEDEDPNPPQDKEAEKLMEKIRACVNKLVKYADNLQGSNMKRLLDSLGEMPKPGEATPSEFSFWIASKMPLTPMQSIQLLSMTKATERLRMEHDIITRTSNSQNCCVQ